MPPLFRQPTAVGSRLRALQRGDVVSGNVAIDALLIVASAFLGIEHRIELFSRVVAHVDLMASFSQRLGRDNTQRCAETVGARVVVDQQHAHAQPFTESNASDAVQYSRVRW